MECFIECFIFSVQTFDGPDYYTDMLKTFLSEVARVTADRFSGSLYM